MEDDLSWMQRALEWARRAQADGEVPVGAVLVREGKVLAEAGNRPIGLNDPTAHAEILALRQAARREGNYRLPGTTLYVTLEPCLMCTGALVHARVARLVFAARDNLRPDSGRVEAWLAHPWLNHRVQVEQGPLGEEAAALLQ
ncbi:MAG: nucleoside deaminase, partial [Gammaproteobacteria bacterium]